MPDQSVDINLALDPVSANFQAGCRAAAAVFEFLASPEGQKACEQWRTGAVKFSDWLNQVGVDLLNVFKGIKL